MVEKKGASLQNNSISKSTNIQGADAALAVAEQRAMNALAQLTEEQRQGLESPDLTRGPGYAEILLAKYEDMGRKIQNGETPSEEEMEKAAAGVSEAVMWQKDRQKEALRNLASGPVIAA